LYPNPTSCCHCWSSMTPWETTPVHTDQYSTTLYSKFTSPKKEKKNPLPRKHKKHTSLLPTDFFAPLFLTYQKFLKWVFFYHQCVIIFLPKKTPCGHQRSFLSKK
jgi:hypothetical protein